VEIMDKWVILGKPECDWCVVIQELMHEHNIEFTYMDIVGNPLSDFLIANGLLLVPQVYHNGYHVGGYDELKNYLEALRDIRSEPRPPIYPGEWNDE
jgi:glutaredoxin